LATTKPLGGSAARPGAMASPGRTKGSDTGACLGSARVTSDDGLEELPASQLPEPYFDLEDDWPDTPFWPARW
jgi:hypothetical protein